MLPGMMMSPGFMAPAGGLKVQDVFAATAYSGNGGTQTLTTGVDLSSYGGMFWRKIRTSALDHWLSDTVRGVNNVLSSDTTAASLIRAEIDSVSTTGLTLNATQNNNLSGNDYIGWSFRKAAKFFDVVTYTGTGATQVINHNLGIKPGLILIKRLDTTGSWYTYHQSIGATQYLKLEATNPAATASTIWNNTEPTDTQFTVKTVSDVNASGGSFVALLFAHDPDTTNGIIQCGSFVTDGSGNGSYTHGWSSGAQFAGLKCTTTTGDWELFDDTRSPSWTTDLRLRANLSNAEDTVTRLSDSGGTLSFANLSASRTYIIWTIRKGPM